MRSPCLNEEQNQMPENRQFLEFPLLFILPASGDKRSLGNKIHVKSILHLFLIECIIRFINPILQDGHPKIWDKHLVEGGYTLVHKIFKILDALSSRQSNTSISTISEMTNITRSAVHRILKALAQEDVVTLIPNRGYILTPKLLSMALDGITQKGLLELAIPVMRDIVAKSKETVSLSVLSGNERVCIYRIEGAYPIIRLIKVGERGPLFKGSVGKIIAAGLTEREISHIVNIYIENGKILSDEVNDILMEIRQVKERGYAVSIGERIQDSASVAVPVKDMAGFVQAALSISSLAERIHDSENRKRYLELLLDSVKQINFKF